MSTSYPENMKVQLNLVPNLWPIEFFALKQKNVYFSRSDSTGLTTFKANSLVVDSP